MVSPNTGWEVTMFMSLNRKITHVEHAWAADEKTAILRAGNQAGLRGIIPMGLIEARRETAT